MPPYLKRAAGRLAVGIGLASVAGVAGVVGLARADEGFARSLAFWRRAFPIYAHYRWAEFRCGAGPEAEYDKALLSLHKRYADEALQIILDMRGFYVKIGQMGSQRDDFVHEEFLTRLRTLQHCVPPRPLAFVEQLICSELDVERAADVFSYISPVPLGAASIGQVHEARLASTGETVCIKVQYPNVEREFAWDMSTIKSFVRLAVPAHASFFEEIERQFASEFDYRREADQLNLVRGHVLPMFGDRVQIPRPYPEYTTKRVLTMEMLDGKVLVDAVQSRAKALRELTQISTVDENPVKPLSSAEYESIARKLQWREYGLAARRLAWNWTIGWIPGVYMIKPAPPVLPPVNIPKTLDLLWEVHAYEMLISGALNGDPHPGNIMLCDDGRLGLIDYGQVKQIGVDARVNIARLCIALMNNDTEEIVRIQRDDVGLKTKHNDPWVLYKHARIAWDNASRETCEGKNVQLFVEELDRRDPILVNPDAYVLPVRMCMMLWGLAYHLHYNHRVCEKLAPMARELLRREDPTFLDRYDEDVDCTSGDCSV
jgi:aarF domain-containing kinase